MKVIAISGPKKYLCEVSHTEIEKYLNLFYNNMKELKIGDEVDLGKGYNHFQDTNNALNETRKFFKSNIKTIDAIVKAFLVENKNLDD